MNGDSPAKAIAASRRELRRRYRAARNSLSPAQQHLAAQNIASSVCDCGAFINAGTIALYWPDDGEVCTSIIIKAAWALGKKIFLPDINASNKMVFVPYNEGGKLVSSTWGIQVPHKHLSTKAQTTFDLIIAPLVAFDANCHRLGRGGGYYDRFLAKMKPKNPNSTALMMKPYIIGLAHSVQQASDIPTQPWDIPLDHIITEHKQFFRGRH